MLECYSKKRIAIFHLVKLDYIKSVNENEMQILKIKEQFLVDTHGHARGTLKQFKFCLT